MKGTAAGLLVLGVYWIVQGIGEIQQNNMNGVTTLVLGILLLPAAKYLWDKDFRGTAK